MLVLRFKFHPGQSRSENLQKVISLAAGIPLHPCPRNRSVRSRSYSNVIGHFVIASSWSFHRIVSYLCWNEKPCFQILAGHLSRLKFEVWIPTKATGITFCSLFSCLVDKENVEESH